MLTVGTWEAIGREVEKAIHATKARKRLVALQYNEYVISDLDIDVKISIDRRTQHKSEEAADVVETMLLRNRSSIIQEALLTCDAEITKAIANVRGLLEANDG